MVPEGLNGFMSIPNSFAAFTPEHRYLPMVTGNGTISEKIELQLPSALKLKLPGPVTLKSPVASYQSSMRLEGKTLVVMREVKFHHDSAVLSPEAYQAVRHFGMAVGRSLRSQVVY